MKVKLPGHFDWIQDPMGDTPVGLSVKGLIEEGSTTLHMGGTTPCADILDETRREKLEFQ